MAQRVTGAPGERLLRRAEVERKLGVSTSTLYRMMDRADFMRPVRIGGRVGWPLSEVEDWIEARKRLRDICHERV